MSQTIHIKCPICFKSNIDNVVYSEKLPQLYEFSDYSARKVIDNYHFEMVRCKNCGLLYSNSFYLSELMNELYLDSKFYYGSEINNLKYTYGKIINYASKYFQFKDTFLDIGCGNGFLLEKAESLGWKYVRGVEPSKETHNKSNKLIRRKIKCGFFNKNDYNNETFDLVFFAMIIEHILDVNQFLNGIYSILKPGGLLVGIAHNEMSLPARILKDRHPIINDEHVYVFSNKTLTKILIKNNFVVLETSKLNNKYSLKYWLQMLPFSINFNSFLFRIPLIKNLLKVQISFLAGNLFFIAKKPS